MDRFASSMRSGVSARTSDKRAPVSANTAQKLPVGPFAPRHACKKRVRSIETRYLRCPSVSKSEYSIALFFALRNNLRPSFCIDLPKRFATKSPILFHQYTVHQ